MASGAVPSTASARVEVGEPKGLVLYHGTHILYFAGGSPRVPRGPAWLAPNPEFSLDAAPRRQTNDAPIRLLTYAVRRPRRCRVARAICLPSSCCSATVASTVSCNLPGKHVLPRSRYPATH